METHYLHQKERISVSGPNQHDPSEFQVSQQPFQDSKDTPSHSGLRRIWFFRTRKRTILTALILVPLLLCAGYWLVGVIAFGSTAKLAELRGVVQFRAYKETRWEPAVQSQTLGRQERIRTGERSGAKLAFFDTSTVDLDENTEVSIEQIAKRRGGSAVDIAIKTWVGKTVVRAVRFVDPSSTLRVETPTASTVVRGARFTVQVEEDGTTQIDLQEGYAEVTIDEMTVPLKMGERIKLESDKQYEVERLFEPDAQLVIDQVSSAWMSEEETFQVTLSENEVNQFLAAMDLEQDFFLTDTQVWFLDDEARIATTLTRPTRVDVSAALQFDIADGRIRPRVRDLAAGVALPIPPSLLDPITDFALGQLEGYLVQAYEFVAFDEIEITDAQLVIVGRRQPDAPVE
jgi:hypothetical protein